MVLSHLAHALTVLWMLVKNFFGYAVHWLPSQERIGSHNIRMVLAEDLEANVALDDTSAPATLEDCAENDTTLSSTEKNNRLLLPKDHVLPLFHTPQPLALQTWPDRRRPEPQSQPQPQSYRRVGLGLVNTHLDSIIMPETYLEENSIASQRSKFVKGLQYSENHAFRFPHQLRPHSPSKTTSLADTNTSPISCPPLSPPSPLTSTTSTPSTPTSPSSPLFPFPSYSSSQSSFYSSESSPSYQVLTPIDEDTPIRLISVPSWRCDPDRAKSAFGSLAQTTKSTIVISGNHLGLTMNNAATGYESVDCITFALEEDEDEESSWSTGKFECVSERALLSCQHEEEMTCFKDQGSVLDDVLSWVENSVSGV